MDAIPIVPEKNGNGQCRNRYSLDLELRRIITHAIRHSPKKREQVAAEMEELVGQRVTRFMLGDFSSPGKQPVRFPAAWIEAFCRVTGDDELQRFAAGPRLRGLIEFAEHELKVEADKQARRRMREKLMATT